MRVLADSAAMSAPVSCLQFNSPRQRRVAVTTAAARLGERGYNIDELVRDVFGSRQTGELTRLSARVAFDIASDSREVPDALRHLGEALLASAAVDPQPGEGFVGFLRRLLAQPGDEDR
jgi:hypothetical protein